MHSLSALGASTVFVVLLAVPVGLALGVVFLVDVPQLLVLLCEYEETDGTFRRCRHGIHGGRGPRAAAVTNVSIVDVVHVVISMQPDTRDGYFIVGVGKLRPIVYLFARCVCSVALERFV